MSSGLYSGVSGLALGSGLYRNVSGLWGGASGLAAGFGGGSPYGGASLYLDFLSMTAPTFDNRITFTRGSNATLTDSTGKLTYAPANLLTYSEQFDNAAWGANGVTRAANTTVAPDGTTTADTLTGSTGTNAVVFRNTGYSAAAGGSTASCYVKAGSAAWLTLSIWAGSGTNGINAWFNLQTGAVGSSSATAGYTVTGSSAISVGGGWYRISVSGTVPTATIYWSLRMVDGDAAFVYTNTVGDTVNVWGAQLEPVTYQTTPGTYVATTSTAYYGPRFDYDPVTLAAKGLLMEDTRTNLVTYSSDWTNAAWSKTNITVTAAATASPDGTVNAQKLAATASAATAVYGQAAVASTSATYTVYVKQGTGATTANGFGLRNVTTLTNLVFITLNFSTGAITYTVGSTGATATNVGNGWWRVQLTATSGITSGDTCAVYVGWSGDVATAGDFLYAYGAQLEAGAFATSYIPTVASTVTRAIDLATMTGTNFSGWYNQNAGTFVSSSVAVPASVGRVLGANDGTSSNVILVGNGFGQIVTAGVSQCFIGATGLTGTIAKQALAYATNDAAYSQNGSAIVSDITVTLPTVDRLAIGAPVTGFAPFTGHIRGIAYFNTRLPNTQLQSITT